MYLFFYYFFFPCVTLSDTRNKSKKKKKDFTNHSLLIFSFAYLVLRHCRFSCFPNFSSPKDKSELITLDPKSVKLPPSVQRTQNRMDALVSELVLHLNPKILVVNLIPKRDFVQVEYLLKRIDPWTGFNSPVWYQSTFFFDFWY